MTKRRDGSARRKEWISRERQTHSKSLDPSKLTEISPRPRNAEVLGNEAPALGVRSELVVRLDIGDSRVVDVSGSESKNCEAEAGEVSIRLVESRSKLEFEGRAVKDLSERRRVVRAGRRGGRANEEREAYREEGVGVEEVGFDERVYEVRWGPEGGRRERAGVVEHLLPWRSQPVLSCQRERREA